MDIPTQAAPMTDTEARLRALLAQYADDHERAACARQGRNTTCYCSLCMAVDDLDIPPISSTFPLDEVMDMIRRGIAA